eukprot:gene192-309_t
MGQAKKRGREKKWASQKKDVWNYSAITAEDMKCPRLEKYYGKQTEVVSKEELQEIMDCFRKPLPVTFRVNPSNEIEARKLVAEIRSIQAGMREAGVPEEKMLKEVEWFPGDGMCWQANVSKKELSRGIEGARKLHEFLLVQTERGMVSRQEIVSMIPPLFLDIQPHHLVLDTCAAPGSKTAQLMESLASQKEEVTGCVVANDMDLKRCEVLVRQTQRIRDFLPNTIITNHNATLFPMPLVPSVAPGCTLEEAELASKEGGLTLEKLQFDRILADVVCSGDGTFRKSLDLWGRWTPHLGPNNHKTQCQILLRSMELVKEGGRIVYSTCSLNPVEDEAVLNFCLRTSRHEFELVDCEGMLPDLKRSPGVSKWVMTDKEGDAVYNTFADIPEEERKRWHLTASMFPSEDAASFNLGRAMRFKPHAQDTGGFFVAVLRKVKDTSARLKQTVSAPQGAAAGADDDASKKVDPDDAGTAAQGESWLEFVKAGKAKPKAVEFSLFQMDKPDRDHLASCLRLVDTFETDRLFCRKTGGKVRRAYLFTPLAQRILIGANLKACNKDGWPGLKVVAGGLRIAEKNSGMRGSFRVTQEGAALLSTVSKPDAVFSATRATFKALLAAPTGPWQLPLRAPEELAQAEGAGAVADLSLEQEKGLAALPDQSVTLVLAQDPPVADPRRIVAAATNKFSNALHLWADAAEVERLRVVLGLPLP